MVKRDQRDHAGNFASKNIKFRKKYDMEFKFSKKFLTLFLTILIIRCIGSNSFADSGSSLVGNKELSSLEVTDGISIYEQLQLWNSIDGVKVTLITENEWIKHVADEYNISYNEAMIKENLYPNRQIDSSISSITPQSYYFTFEKENKYYGDGNYSAIIGAAFKLANEGSFRWIDDVVDVYTRAGTGHGRYEWNELGTHTHELSSNGNKLSLFGIGYFSVETTEGFSLGWILEGHVGQTNIYRSETFNITGTYKVY